SCMGAVIPDSHNSYMKESEKIQSVRPSGSCTEYVESPATQPGPVSSKRASSLREGEAQSKSALTASQAGSGSSSVHPTSRPAPTASTAVRAVRRWRRSGAPRVADEEGARAPLSQPAEVLRSSGGLDLGAHAGLADRRGDVVAHRAGGEVHVGRDDGGGVPLECVPEHLL